MRFSFLFSKPKSRPFLRMSQCGKISVVNYRSNVYWHNRKKIAAYFMLYNYVDDFPKEKEKAKIKKSMKIPNKVETVTAFVSQTV